GRSAYPAEKDCPSSNRCRLRRHFEPGPASAPPRGRVLPGKRSPSPRDNERIAGAPWHGFASRVVLPWGTRVGWTCARGPQRTLGHESPLVKRPPPISVAIDCPGRSGLLSSHPGDHALG